MRDRFADWLRSDLPIGSKTVHGRLALAPMSKLGHVAFRELVAGYGGCGLLFTEMCSARALPSANPKVSPCFRWRDEQLDRLVCQVPIPGTWSWLHSGWSGKDSLGWI